LRAVVFDYGMVLTGPPDPEAHAELVRVTGLSSSRLDSLYWADRDAYDKGEMTGEEFWQKITEHAGLNLSRLTIDELTHWDARMWMKINPVMLTWQLALKHHGLLTAIVSNMGDAVLREMEGEFDWLSRFDVLVWSYQLKTAKPDPKIYLYVLEKLGTTPNETLFIDDRQQNVDAAVALGIKGILFTNLERLRADLITFGFGADVPLP
jgi:putative hydrolase of the HAD superfamily